MVENIVTREIPQKTCLICNHYTANHKIVLHGQEYSLCDWDALVLKQFVDCRANHSVVNIAWGAGKIPPSDWFFIRDVLRKNNIKEVLEIGIGLSSELFVNEGVSLVGWDILKPHVEMLQKLESLKERAAFYHYEKPQDIFKVKEVFPNRQWDFVFVDGAHERSNETRLAMEVSNRFIYLHDRNMGEQSFFPNEDWVVDRSNEKFFERKK